MSFSKLCPCGSEIPYKKCCRVFHKGTKYPGTASELMKSRYSAYVKGLEKYIRETWHPDYLPPDLHLTDINWLNLDIVSATDGLKGDSEGTVHFKAYYRSSSGEECLEENSHFIFEDGRWFYTEAL